MRDQRDLPTPRQADYAERKRAIAETRAQLVSDLLYAQKSEERGHLSSAWLFSDSVYRLAEDLVALYESWIDEYPPDDPPTAPGLVST